MKPFTWFLVAKSNYLSVCTEYEFAALCLRCSVMPSMTHWLSNVTEAAKNPQTHCVATFKQVCGLLSEITTRMLSAVQDPREKLDPSELLEIFREVTLFYVQCAVQEDEALVRIGNSCFR